MKLMMFVNMQQKHRTFGCLSMFHKLAIVLLWRCVVITVHFLFWALCCHQWSCSLELHCNHKSDPCLKLSCNLNLFCNHRRSSFSKLHCNCQFSSSVVQMENWQHKLPISTVIYWLVYTCTYATKYNHFCLDIYYHFAMTFIWRLPLQQWQNLLSLYLSFLKF